MSSIARHQPAVVERTHQQVGHQRQVSGRGDLAPADGAVEHPQSARAGSCRRSARAGPRPRRRLRTASPTSASASPADSPLNRSTRLDSKAWMSPANEPVSGIRCSSVASAMADDHQLLLVLEPAIERRRRHLGPMSDRGHGQPGSSPPRRAARGWPGRWPGRPRRCAGGLGRRAGVGGGTGVGRGGRAIRGRGGPGGRAGRDAHPSTRLGQAPRRPRRALPITRRLGRPGRPRAPRRSRRPGRVRARRRADGQAGRSRPRPRRPAPRRRR